MFDEKKFDRIVETTHQLFEKYGDNKEAQEIIRDNLLILVDMLFDEFERGIKKGKYRAEYVKLADRLHKNIVEQRKESTQ
ncbi:TPA: hypothetical protein ACNABL_004760 [Escherichia coli]